VCKLVLCYLIVQLYIIFKKGSFAFEEKNALLNTAIYTLCRYIGMYTYIS